MATGTAAGLPPRTTTAVLIINGGPTPGFSLAASPSSRAVTAGTATTFAETVTPTGGFTGTVALGLSGLPAAAGGTFSPATVPGTGTSSTLNVTTAASTPGKLTLVHQQSLPRPPFFGTTYAPQDPQAQLYACPTPPVSVEQCRQGPVVGTDYVQLIHARCHNTR